MDARQIMAEILALPASERARVIEFTSALKFDGALPPERLAKLAQRLADSEDTESGLLLKEELVRGFYGDSPNA
jgi:hypothetical protein